MNFEDKLISGQFVKRYKRFFVDVKIDGTPGKDKTFFVINPGAALDGL